MNIVLDLKGIAGNEGAYMGASFVVIAPPQIQPRIHHFNSKSIEALVADVFAINFEATIVTKSTIPVGYTEQVRTKLNTNQIMFSPKFLREGKPFRQPVHRPHSRGAKAIAPSCLLCC